MVIWVWDISHKVYYGHKERLRNSLETCWTGHAGRLGGATALPVLTIRVKPRHGGASDTATPGTEEDSRKWASFAR